MVKHRCIRTGECRQCGIRKFLSGFILHEGNRTVFENKVFLRITLNSFVSTKLSKWLHADRLLNRLRIR